MFGWTPAEYDEAPAPLCDWFVAIANAEAEVAESRERDARRQSG